MLADKRLRWGPRAIDAGWHYAGSVPVSVTGFNPWSSTVYYPARSCFAKWLDHPHRPARRLNPDDRLLNEVLIAVHDYLHAWAYWAVQDLLPRLGFGTRAITQRNIEDLVFCHLLTEAVATVGLDYWYLCCVDLNDCCDIGTRMRAGLTVSYHERYLDEYRKFFPRLCVQSPAFFGALVRFYCSGDFYGFDARALARSPRLLGWLRHELLYGEKQREYTRLWLAYLSSGDIRYSPKALKSRVAIDAPWQRRLIEEVGRLLWAKVKEDRVDSFSPRLSARDGWRGPAGKAPDYRFVNYNRARSGALRADASFDYLLYQFVSRFEHQRVDPELAELVPLLLEKKDFAAMRYLFRRERPLEARALEPVNLLFLN